jgi:hypothetical protein
MTIGHSSQALPAREKRAAQFRRVCLAGTVALAVSVSLSSCSERLDAQVPPGAPANPVAAPAPVPVPAPIAPAVAPRVARFADFGAEMAQADARHVADWVADSQNNAGMEFIIVDKQNARVYVFDATAHLRATSAVLLGSAKGDESVPGIGTRPLAQVKPSERTTPAASSPNAVTIPLAKMSSGLITMPPCRCIVCARPTRGKTDCSALPRRLRTTTAYRSAASTSRRFFTTPM